MTNSRTKIHGYNPYEDNVKVAPSSNLVATSIRGGNNLTINNCSSIRENHPYHPAISPSYLSNARAVRREDILRVINIIRTRSTTSNL